MASWLGCYLYEFLLVGYKTRLACALSACCYEDRFAFREMRVSHFTSLIIVLFSFSAQSCQRSPADQSQSKASSSRASDQARVERDGMVLIKGGKFLMGTNDGMPFEAPIHEVSVK